MLTPIWFHCMHSCTPTIVSKVIEDSSSNSLCRKAHARHKHTAGGRGMKKRVRRQSHLAAVSFCARCPSVGARHHAPAPRPCRGDPCGRPLGGPYPMRNNGKRGAQPGNQNARKHGFYSMTFQARDLQLLDELPAADLTAEQSIWRVAFVPPSFRSLLPAPACRSHGVPGAGSPMPSHWGTRTLRMAPATIDLLDIRRERLRR